MEGQDCRARGYRGVDWLVPEQQKKVNNCHDRRYETKYVYKNEDENGLLLNNHHEAFMYIQYAINVKDDDYLVRLSEACYRDVQGTSQHLIFIGTSAKLGDARNI